MSSRTPKWTGEYFGQVDLGTTEVKDITRDFTSETLDADGNQIRTVTDVTIRSDPDDLTIGPATILAGEQKVYCQISAPREQTLYAIWHEATLTGSSDTNTIKPLPLAVNGINKGN